MSGTETNTVSEALEEKRKAKKGKNGKWRELRISRL